MSDIDVDEPNASRVEIKDKDDNGIQQTSKLDDEEEELLSEADEVFELVVDVVSTLLGWSWEGIIGIDKAAADVANVYKDINGDELKTIIGAESAIIKMGKRRIDILSQVPGFPVLGALNELKKWVASVKAGELTPKEARLALKENVKSMDGLYHPLIRILGVIILDIGFAIDLVGNWEGVVVTIILSVITGTYRK